MIFMNIKGGKKIERVNTGRKEVCEFVQPKKGAW